jgi:hypothetical protein
MPDYANGAYIIKPGDNVVTPTGRPAVVEGIDNNGFRICRYLDRAGGDVNLPPKLLKVTRAAPVRPWRSPIQFDGLDIDAGPRLTRRRLAG